MAQTILRLPAVKIRTGLSRSSIYLGMAKGEFPKNISLSKHCVGWVESEVTAWIDRRIAEGRKK